MKKRLHITLAAFSILISSGLLAQLIHPDSLKTMRVYDSVEDAMANPNDVYRLDLSRQKLKAVPADIFKLKNLNELILDKNKLSEIPGDISQLIYLQIFSCQHNEIDTIPNSIFKLKHLTKLDIADNLISSIPDNVGQLTELEILSAWDNPIEYYSESLADLEKLKFLDLLHNQVNYDTQDRLKAILPSTKIIMSPPCNCQDGGE